VVVELKEYMKFDDFCGVMKVDLGVIEGNLLKMKSRCGGRLLLPLKADAYGCGALELARYFDGLDVVDYFGFAYAFEAFALDSLKLKTPVLILGYSDYSLDGSLEVVKRGFEQVVGDVGFLDLLDSAGRRLGVKARVHLNVDTGMGRAGVLFGDALEMLEYIDDLEWVELVGVMTHFAVSPDVSESSVEYTRMQISRFEGVIEQARGVFGDGLIFHAANSGGVCYYRESCFDMVRTGIGAYGVGCGELDLKPAVSVYSRVTFVKEVLAGSCIGYNREFVVDRDILVATVGIGYADGLDKRLYAGDGHDVLRDLVVKIGEGEFRAVGRISMDQFLVEVDESVKVGDVVEVLVIDDEALEYSGEIGVSGYELLIGFGNGVRILKEYIN